MKSQLGSALILVAAIGFAVAASFPWSSPDGSIALTLHDGWRRGNREGVKTFSSNSTSYLAGSKHSLLLGGILRSRYLSLQVAHFPSLQGHAVPLFMNTLANDLRAQGHEIVRHGAVGTSGTISCRFIHSDDPVSQIVIVIGAETGTFIIEMTAPRQDEDRLAEEAARLVDGVEVLRPPVHSESSG